MKHPLFGQKHYYMYMLDGIFDGVITTLTAGTFFAKLTTSLGVSDATTAILAQVGNIMVALFVVSSFISHSRRAKPLIAGLHLCYQLLISTIYVLPFFLLEPDTAEIILLILLLVAKAVSFSVLNARSGWYISIIPKEKHSGVFGISQAVVNCILFLVSLLMGVVIDRMEENGNLKGAFLVIFFILLAMSALNFATLLLTRPPSEEFRGKENESVFHSIGTLLKNDTFRAIMIQKLIYAVAVTALTAYQSTFLIGEIGLSMTEASLVAAVEAAIYAIALAVFGKLGERIPLSRVYAIGMILMTFAAFFCIFLSPTSFLVPYILFALCYRCGYAAFMVGFFVVYRVIPESHYTSSGAVINIPQCLLVFLTTLVLAPLFNYLKLDLNNTLFGHTFYAQQTFAVISTVLYIISVAYFYLVVKKRLKKHGQNL